MIIIIFAYKLNHYEKTTTTFIMYAFDWIWAKYTVSPVTV